MRASIITVGDELLAGDVENTNATWLAGRLTDRGVDVREVAVLPDEVDRIARRVRRHADAYDATLVTGGVGGTPDDVTVDAVAEAFGRSLVVEPAVRRAVRETVAEVRERRPGFDPDVDAWAALPAGSRPIENSEGLSPGCAIEGVYVLPGIPSEMKPMFESVASEFDGDVTAETVRAAGSESDLVPHLEAARERFPVRVGCYPTPGTDEKRIKLTASDPEAVADARAWLVDRLREAGAHPP